MLMEAFRALSAMKLFNFSMDLGGGGLDDYKQLARTVQLLVQAEVEDPHRQDFLSGSHEGGIFGDDRISEKVLAKPRKKCDIGSVYQM